MPSTPVGLETQSIPDGNFDSSSVSSATTSPYFARLNELRGAQAWCSNGSTASEWLEVSLGKQYTLTHIALQGVGGAFDVTALTVKYEKTRDGTNWVTYSKLVDGRETSKVMLPYFVCSVLSLSPLVVCSVLLCFLFLSCFVLLFCWCCCSVLLFSSLLHFHGHFIFTRHLYFRFFSSTCYRPELW